MVHDGYAFRTQSDTEVLLRLHARGGEVMLEFLRPLSAQAEPLERMLALEQRFFLADHNLIYTDKMSMAAQLRAACGVRCVQRPASIGSIASIWSADQAMEPYLPREVIYRHNWSI